MTLVEKILHNSWPKEYDPLPATFNRITFDEAMDKFGTDKPDMRYKEFQVKTTEYNGFQFFPFPKILLNLQMFLNLIFSIFQMKNITDLVEFTGEQKTDDRSRAYIIAVQENFASSFTDTMGDTLSGVAMRKTGVQFTPIRVDDDWDSKCNLTDSSVNAINERFNLQPNDVVLFAYGPTTRVVSDALSVFSLI